MTRKHEYERPGGRSGDGAPKTRRMPAALRGKPFRRLQREFYQRYYRYPHRNFLVTALPKSGSTWIARMLLELPGTFRWFPERFNTQTLKDPDFHEFAEQDLLRPPPGYTVTKVHAGPSAHNRDILRHAGRPYVVLVRDLRDIAVSWAHFVAIRPENAFYNETKDLDLSGRIDHFIEHILPIFAAWERGWRRHIHPDLGMLIAYEDLLADTRSVMSRVFTHYGVPRTDTELTRIIEAHTFARTTGRAAGDENAKDFNRKGIAGDWQNHLTDEQAQRIVAPTLLGGEGDSAAAG
ncbi:MAG: sulfotransferase domain-containing protein [Phycisphaerales bacterium]|nr:sulfotransferase domain-containing protein [Phycisphaerales bacterium]